MYCNLFNIAHDKRLLWLGGSLDYTEFGSQTMTLKSPSP